MLRINNQQFEKIVREAIDTLPDDITQNMKNVAIIIEAEPTAEQRQRLHLFSNQTLFGLYEGIPLTSRGNNYNLVLPDKITIFKNPLITSCDSLEELNRQVKRTVWHEIAHHYGLDHNRINRLLKKS